MQSCSACLAPDAQYVCSCCHAPYCSQACQKTDWDNNEHSLVCEAWPDESLCGQEELLPDDGEGEELIEAMALPFQPPALDNSYKTRVFYKRSLAIMKSLRKDNFFAWMCVQSYKTSPIINAILFKGEDLSNNSLSLPRFVMNFFLMTLHLLKGEDLF